MVAIPAAGGARRDPRSGRARLRRRDRDLGRLRRDPPGRPRAGAGAAPTLAPDGGLPVCGPNGNGIVAVGSRAPMWGDSVAPLEPGGVAMISQSGNVAVNALGSRRGIRYHTVVSTGNQAVARRRATGSRRSARDGVRSIALFLEEDGDGERSRPGAGGLRRAGDRVAVLKVGASEAGARAASAHTGALAGDQRVFSRPGRGGRRRVGARPARAAGARPRPGEPRARPRGGGGLAVLTCSGGDSGVAADEAEREGCPCPSLRRRPRERLDGAAARRGDDRQPARLHRDDLGATPTVSRQVTEAVGDDPAIDQLLLLYDEPDGLSAPQGRLGRGPRGDRGRGRRDGAATLVASTLPDLMTKPAA